MIRQYPPAVMKRLAFRKREAFWREYEKAFRRREDEYWDAPRTNSLGGWEHPEDGEVAAWRLAAFEEAAERLGCQIESRRDSSDDCYHRVRRVAAHPKHGPIAGLEYIDCVCGDHGPRNVRLFRPEKEVAR